MINRRTLAASVIVIVIAVSLIFALIFFGPAVCSPSENRGTCLREWAGALSGYVAAAGALLAAWLTLKPLHAQVREAVRQTAFVVGESPPTLSASPYAELEQVTSYKIRLVNWNRNPISIASIQLEVESRPGEVFSSALMNLRGVNGLRYNPTYDLRTHHRLWLYTSPFIIPGWEDRSAQPPFLEAEVVVAVENGPVLERGTMREVSAVVSGEILGEDRKRISLRANSRVELR